MKLEKHPKIAVYSPKSKQPWDDAVTLVLTYAEIPYDIIFDDEVLGIDGAFRQFRQAQAGAQCIDAVGKSQETGLLTMLLPPFQCIQPERGVLRHGPCLAGI